MLHYKYVFSSVIPLHVRLILFSDGYYMYLDTSKGANGDKARLQSPLFTPHNNKQVSFASKYPTTYIISLIIYIVFFEEVYIILLNYVY